MNAVEHFDWAVGRAMEYVEAGNGGFAMSSLISDLYKHAGTLNILTPDLLSLFVGEVVIGGAQGARRFIEGLPRPVVSVDHDPATARRLVWESYGMGHALPDDDVAPNAGSAS